MFHFGFPFFLFGGALYFLPTIIAVGRHKTNTLGILLVNFFLGWSVIGWVIALVWAVSIERVDHLSSAHMVPIPQGARRFLFEVRLARSRGIAVLPSVRSGPVVVIPGRKARFRVWTPFQGTPLRDEWPISLVERLSIKVKSTKWRREPYGPQLDTHRNVSFAWQRTISIS